MAHYVHKPYLSNTVPWLDKFSQKITQTKALGKTQNIQKDCAMQMIWER